MAIFISNVSCFARPIEAGDWRSSIFRLLRLPFFSQLHAIWREGPRHRKARHPLLPGLTLLRKERIHARQFLHSSVRRNGEFDALVIGIPLLNLPMGFLVAGLFHPHARIQSPKLSSRMNRGFAAL